MFVVKYAKMVDPSVDFFTSVVMTVGVLIQWMYNDPTVSVVFAGMAGGAVRWYSEREPWKTGIGSIFIGGICAKYLGPFTFGIMERISGMTFSDEAGTTGAFAMGLGGILIIRYFMDHFKVKLDRNEEEGQSDDEER